MQNAGPISLALALVGAGVVTLKVVAATAGRVAAAALRRRTAQQELQRDVDAVMERIKVGCAVQGRSSLLYSASLKSAVVLYGSSCTCWTWPSWP